MNIYSPFSIFMNSSENFIEKYVEKVRQERKDLYTENSGRFFQLDIEKRDFFVKIGTVSATIGAFSFVIFDQVPRRGFLIVGDAFLLLVIMLCFYSYLQLLKKDERNLHRTYHDIFERMIQEVEILQSERSNIEKADYLKEELSKLKPYSRPKLSILHEQNIVLILVILALCFVALSLF